MAETEIDCIEKLKNQTNSDLPGTVTFFIHNKVFTNFLYTGQILYGTKFTRDKVYTGQSLYEDKVYTRTKFIRGQSLYRTKFTR